MLKQYYGDEVEGQTVGGSDALDVDNPDFNSDLYLNKVVALTSAWKLTKCLI